MAASPRLVLAAVLLVTFAAYTPLLGDWFKTDDFWYLNAAQTKSVTEYVPEAFNFTDSAEPIGLLQGQYRPLFSITILSEAKLFGLHVVPYHLASIAIHLANTILVWAIARRLM